MVIEALASRHKVLLKNRAEGYLYGKGFIDDAEVILIEPLTFMNLSGVAVRAALQSHRLTENNLIVIHDDIDMETGRLRIREKGSSGGHKGIQSIINAIGTNSFIRIRIGVGRPTGIAASDYVLEGFTKQDNDVIGESITVAADAIEFILTHGVGAAMNRFNA